MARRVFNRNHGANALRRLEIVGYETAIAESPSRAVAFPGSLRKARVTCPRERNQTISARQTRLHRQIRTRPPGRTREAKFRATGWRSATQFRPEKLENAPSKGTLGERRKSFSLASCRYSMEPARSARTA